MTKADDSFSVTLDAPGYSCLAAVFERAFKQASEGKGKERHANALPFDQQPMQTIARAHGVGFLTGQASKKAEEAHGLPHEAKIAELLGAMNYLAGAVIFLESQRKAKPVELEHQLGTEFMTGSGSQTVGVGMMSPAQPRCQNRSPSGALCLNCKTKCDGWISWISGRMPNLPSGAKVELKLANGTTQKIHHAPAIDWANHGTASDIIAYRVGHG